jgi:hypothetical protein
MSRVHSSKGWNKLRKQILEKGIRLSENGNKCTFYPPNPKDKIYISHTNKKAWHPIRRWAKELNPPININIQNA